MKEELEQQVEREIEKYASAYTAANGRWINREMLRWSFAHIAKQAYELGRKDEEKEWDKWMEDNEIMNEYN